MRRNKKKHIFFLDNEPTIYVVIKEILEKSGFKVSCFSNPIECLTKVRSNKCDLLITDLNLPKMDGIELLTEIQHFAPWIPVLVVSGSKDMTTAVKAIKAGIVDFIEKPFEKRNLVQKIKSIIQESTSPYSELGKPLSQQEMKILRLIMDGKSNKEIANKFNRSICTIEYHRARIMHKLGVNNIVDLVKRTISLGLIDLKEKPLAPKAWISVGSMHMDLTTKTSIVEERVLSHPWFHGLFG